MPIDSNSVKTEITPPMAVSAEMLLSAENLGLGELSYLMAQYIEDSIIYFSAVSESDNGMRSNYLCKYDMENSTNEVIKIIEGNAMGYQYKKVV